MLLFLLMLSQACRGMNTTCPVLALSPCLHCLPRLSESCQNQPFQPQNIHESLKIKRLQSQNMGRQRVALNVLFPAPNLLVWPLCSPSAMSQLHTSALQAAGHPWMHPCASLCSLVHPWASSCIPVHSGILWWGCQLLLCPKQGPKGVPW